MFITLTILPTPLRCFKEFVHFISKLVFTVRLLSVLRDHSVFIPATTANNLWLRVRRISLPDFIHSIFLSFLILQKEPVFPFLMLSVKQGNYWYHYITLLSYLYSSERASISLFIVEVPNKGTTGTITLHLLSYLYSSERASNSLFNVECQTRELLVHYITFVVLSLFFRKSQYFPF